MVPYGNMADKSANYDNIYTANSFSWKDEANGLEKILILKILIKLRQYGQLNQASSMADTCDKNIFIEIKAIDVWNGGAGEAMAPPGKNLSRASSSSGQFKSQCFKRDPSNLIDLFLSTKMGFSSVN